MDCSKWTLLWYSVFTITPIQHCARACKFLGASVNISKQSIIDVDRGDFDLNTAGMTLYIPSLSGHRTRKPICLYKESINFQKKDIIVALDRQAVCARRLKDGLCRSLTSVINNWSMGNIVTLLLVTIKEDTNENKHMVHFHPVVFWHLISSFATEAADITSWYCSSRWRRRNAALRSCWTRCSSNNNDSWLVDVASDADMAWVSVSSCGWALGTVAFLKRFAAVWFMINLAGHLVR